MKGLLIKDFYSILASRRILLLYVFIFGGVGIFTGSFSFAVTLISVLTISLSISTFNYDEYYHWERYAASAPVSRRTIVTAKYLFVLLLAACGAVVSLVLMGITWVFHPDISLLEGIVGLASSCLVCLTGVSLSLPFFYKLGAEKGRIAFMFLLGLPFMLIILATTIKDLDFATLLEANIGTILTIGILFCLAAIIGSYVASVKIYCSKDLS
ncbi:MAG: ABC-2 transporter permease [Angelakisella sp.]|nr:ABC-2 transporter permease [Angelakisella sp.]